MTHAHDHDHSHHANISQANEGKVLMAFTFIFSFMVIECLGGLWSGSLALLADAGHMLTDAAALALAYAAFRLGRRAANNKHTFGYLRFEVIASLINALTLLGMVLWIVVEAWERWSSPSPICDWNHDVDCVYWLAGECAGVMDYDARRARANQYPRRHFACDR